MPCAGPYRLGLDSLAGNKSVMCNRRLSGGVLLIPSARGLLLQWVPAPLTACAIPWPCWQQSDDPIRSWLNIVAEWIGLCARPFPGRNVTLFSSPMSIKASESPSSQCRLLSCTDASLPCAGLLVRLPDAVPSLPRSPIPALPCSACPDRDTLIWPHGTLRACPLVEPVHSILHRRSCDKHWVVRSSASALPRTA